MMNDINLRFDPQRILARAKAELNEHDYKFLKDNSKDTILSLMNLYKEYLDVLATEEEELRQVEELDASNLKSFIDYDEAEEIGKKLDIELANRKPLESRRTANRRKRRSTNDEEANGWQEYKLVKEANQWVEDPSLDPEKPAFAFYTGNEDAEQREYMRQIFNMPVKFSDDFPPSLKASVESKPKKKLCLFMITAAGAEGITLANVRHVHIMEPHWNPARHDQVIGRAIRICSHAKLPVEERTVRVSFYLSVFSEDQSKSSEGTNIVLVRRSDMAMRRYEGDPVEVFMSTDEYLYEKAYEKEKINQKVGLLLKQAAVDCEIHRKLHSRETPVITCMRFDSAVKGEDLAFKPNIKQDDLDSTYLRNLQRRKRRLQKVSIKGMIFLLDPDTKEIFDGPAFEDNNRLMRMGALTSPGQIQWIPDLRIA